MKQNSKLFTLVAAFAFVVLSLSGVTLAQEERPQELEILPTEEVEADEEATANDSNRSDRAQERRARVEATIDQNRIERVRGRCVAAQARLQAAVQRATGVETSSSEVFANILDRASRLSARLQAAGVDTTELDGQLTDFEQSTNSFVQQIDQYRVALEDAESIDCEEDPEAFAYALEDARETLPELRQLSQQIRSQVRESIIATLQSIRDSLNDTVEEGEQAEDNDESAVDGEDV